MLEINKIIFGDCLEELKKLPDESIDAIITDPPAGISFMGKTWDTFDKNMFGKKGEEVKNDLKIEKNFEILPRYSNSDLNGFQDFIYEVMKECLRVLKSGGHCIVWAIPRTSHHTAMGIERAGFEIRDVIHHIFNTGFPKSYNIGKGIEGKLTIGSASWNDFHKLNGELGESKAQGSNGLVKLNKEQDNRPSQYASHGTLKLEATTEEAKKYEGFGTALKPACEHWILARKPLNEKTIAEQVLKNGCGGIDIEGCRIPLVGIEEHNTNAKSGLGKNWTYGHSTIDEISGKDLVRYESSGRFPANIIVQDDALNDGTISKSPNGKVNRQPREGNVFTGESCGFKSENNKTSGFGDTGSKSRYFDLDLWSERNGIIQLAKPSRREKNNGCENLEPKAKCDIDKMGGEKCTMKTGSGNERNVKYLNSHPTVKSIGLMSWLVKLISKEGDLVLDPFGGSGTTACACIQLKRNFILMEKEKDYIEIINNRIKYYQSQSKL